LRFPNRSGSEGKNVKLQEGTTMDTEDLTFDEENLVLEKWGPELEEMIMRDLELLERKDPQ
jgi:hypothetical protein